MIFASRKSPCLCRSGLKFRKCSQEQSLPRESPRLPAAPSSWVCPPPARREGQGVTCTFFFPSWPFPPRREDRVAGEQAGGGESCSGLQGAHLYLYPRPGPLATLTPSRRSQSPCEGPEGTSSPVVRAASRGTTSPAVCALMLTFFSIMCRRERF